jgi:hypothetical protein
MEFRAGYTETIRMLYQRSMVADSNGCIITRIDFLAGREKRRLIFEMSQSSEKALNTCSELRTFSEQLSSCKASLVVACR